MTVTDEELREAAPRATAWLLDTLPSQADCDHAFSFRFERKMRLLLTARKHSPRRNRMTCKRAAMLALVALLSALTVTMSVSALREQFFRVFSAVRENGIEYYIRAEDRETLYFHRITLGCVPEDFEMEWEHLDQRDLWSTYHLCYTHADGRTFSVSQSVEERYSGVFGDVESETVTVQGDEAQLQQDGTYCCLFWVHGPNIMTLTSDGMTREEIMKIAEQIQW